MSISSIHASDLENATVENDQIAISDNMTVNNDVHLDENPPGTFDDLKEDISHLSPGDVFNVTRDYNFSGSKANPNGENLGILISVNNITINGNGHTIDGNHQSAFFRVQSDYVKIFNLTFINGEYHGMTVKMSVFTKPDYSEWITYYYHNDYSPILWSGYKGVIDGCIFRGNTAINGAAITWDGNGGLINNSLFLNNFASGIGGALYVKGKNDTIINSVFYNSTSLLSGEAIYLDRKEINCNFTCIFAKCIPFIDGKITDIDVNYLHYSLESIVADKKVDLFKIIYSSITNNYTHCYGDNIIYFSGFNGTDFMLNFAKSFDDLEIIYGKSYHFTKISNYNEVFQALIRDDYQYELTFIKNIQVHNKSEYEKARTTTDSVFKVEPFAKIIEDDLKSMKSYTTYKELLVTFAGQYTFNSKSTWTPSNAFNLININGNGSKISIESDSSDEYTWARLKDTKCIFSVCNLRIEGFNMAVENLGGTCIFNNVIFHNNRMDYWIKQDYGAAICNTGTCVCNNCTFTNNYCKNGGAIFSQGALEVNNCTFKGNYAYGHGDNIFNADKGVVKVDGVQIKGTKHYVYHDESICKRDVTIYSFLSVCLATAVGFTIGTIFGSPALGIALGTLAGAAIGGCMAGYLCSHIYDRNFDKTTLCVCLILSCALAGAAGAELGSYVTAIPEDYVPTYDLYDADVCIASSPSSETSSVCSQCPAVQEYLNLDSDPEFQALLNALRNNIRVSPAG